MAIFLVNNFVFVHDRNELYWLWMTLHMLPNVYQVQNNLMTILYQSKFYVNICVGKITLDRWVNGCFSSNWFWPLTPPPPCVYFENVCGLFLKYEKLAINVTLGP